MTELFTARQTTGTIVVKETLQDIMNEGELGVLTIKGLTVEEAEKILNGEANVNDLIFE